MEIPFGTVLYTMYKFGPEGMSKTFPAAQENLVPEMIWTLHQSVCIQNVDCEKTHDTSHSDQFIDDVYIAEKIYLSRSVSYTTRSIHKKYLNPFEEINSSVEVPYP